MIQNKMIINKKVLEELIGETIAVIYLLDENNIKIKPIKCNFDTKIYMLDKDENYFILGAKHSFRIEKGVII